MKDFRIYFYLLNSPATVLIHACFVLHGHKELVKAVKCWKGTLIILKTKDDIIFDKKSNVTSVKQKY